MSIEIDWSPTDGYSLRSPELEFREDGRPLYKFEIPNEVAAEIERLQACERALEIAETALRDAAEKFQRIQWVALPSTMPMARAADGEEAVRDALTAIEATKGGAG